MARCRFIAIALLSCLALNCSGEDDPAIVERWSRTFSGPIAPPGPGPQDRVLVALTGSAGGFETLEASNGLTIEGPFPTLPTERGPAAIGGFIFVVSTIGRVTAHDLAGTMLFSQPATPLGKASPLAVGADDILRVGSTSGRVYAVQTDGTERFDVTIAGAIDSRPAIATDGTTYVATDIGEVVGFDLTGAEVFRATVNAPASGVSVGAGRIAVGEIDGLRVFDSAGAEVFRRPRAARVTGTEILADGTIIAWGEDGIFERIGADGSELFSFVAGPPISANAIALEDGNFGVFDDAGTVHLVDGASGTAVTTFALDAAPFREIVPGAGGFVYVGNGATLKAIDLIAIAQ